jgi:hypothetical protein
MRISNRPDPIHSELITIEQKVFQLGGGRVARNVGIVLILSSGIVARSKSAKTEPAVSRGAPMRPFP